MSKYGKRHADLSLIMQELISAPASRQIDGKIIFQLFAQRCAAGSPTYIWPEDHPDWMLAVRYSLASNSDAAAAQIHKGELEAKWRGELSGSEQEFIAFVDSDTEPNASSPNVATSLIVINDLRVPKLSSDIAAARSIMKLALPGFWISHGHCQRSGHASCGPDYNGVSGDARKQLADNWPEAIFHTGFHADIGPDDGDPTREARAIMHVTLQAITAQIRQRQRQQMLTAETAPAAI